MRSLFAVLVLLASCDAKPETPAATPPQAPRAATLPSGYRVNAALPSGTLRVHVRARAAAEPRVVDIPPGHRSRNPEDAAFCEGCASRGSLPDEGLVVDPKNLGIKNVAVSIKNVAEGALQPLARATLDNACCRFVPHVAFVPVGSPVALKNSDPMSHAVVISTRGGTQLYMVTIPSGDRTETTTIDVPGILSVTCPIHSWMSGWLIATRHPYVALTDERGEARLEHVPAGSHDLVFWHERLGTAARAVAVTRAAESDVILGDADFTKN